MEAIPFWDGNLGESHPYSANSSRWQEVITIGMGDIDVDEHIKTYWSNKIKGSTITENTIYDEFSRAIEEIKNAVLINPETRESSIRASRFFMFLDLEPIVPTIDKYYVVRDGSEGYPRRAMTKCMFWRRTMGFNFTQAYMHLKNHPVDALELGFEKEDGQVKIPNWRTLRYFENERLGLKGQKDVNNTLIRAVRDEAESLGMSIGKNVCTDAMPVETVANDDDGEWNEHYKKKILKSVILSDLDHMLPISHKVIGGNDDEGNCLNELIRDRVNKLENSDMKGIWIDGRFTSNKNLADIYVAWGFENVNYHITVSWDMHKTFEHKIKGKKVMFEPEQEIEWLYPKLWREEYYVSKSKASLEYKMKCLIKAGIYEPVVAYFRNKYCAMYEEAPDSTLDIYHKRNVEEGIHGILKVHYHLEDYLDRRGRKNIERTVVGCMNAALAVALARLQHKVKTKLISTAYLT